MKSLEYNDFAKLNIKVCEVKNIEKDKVKLQCGKQSFEISSDYKLKKGQQIVIGFTKDGIALPFIKNSLITPEKNIISGAQIS